MLTQGNWSPYLYPKFTSKNASLAAHKQKGLAACGLQPLLKLKNKLIAESDAWKEWTILQPEIRVE